MIALVALLALAPGSVVEMPDSAAQEISIQALVKLPVLGAKDLAKLRIVTGAIPKQTQVYPRREMLTVTGGNPVKCDLTPDIVRVELSVAPSNLKAGLSLMESLLRDATLTQDNLDLAAQELPPSDYWSAALNPVVAPVVKLGQDEAVQLYHRVFRPERVTLSLGGKLVPGEAQDIWESRMASWNMGREPRGYFDITPQRLRERSPDSVTTIDLVGATVPPADAAFPSKLLALFALGTGKASSLFRVVREKHAWSYRQEAVLSPTMDGWAPSLLFACIPADDTAQRVDTIRADLLADVNSWTPATRDRALGMASAVFRLHVDFNPLYLMGAYPMGDSLEDRTFLNGYWMMKTGKPWNVDALLQSMGQVSIDDLKAQATAIVSESKAHVLAGN